MARGVKQSDLTSAKGPRTQAVTVNKRVAVTYKLKKTWVGLLIDFKSGTITQQRLKSRADAGAFLTPRKGYAGRIELGPEPEDFI